MMSKHTPGKWIVTQDVIDDEESLDYFRIETKGHEIAARIISEDDARLISQAPALLEAASALVNAWNEGCDNTELRRRMSDMQAAILAATGEQP